MSAAEKRDRLLSVTEVAEIIGMSENSSRELMKRIGAVYFGRRGIVKLSERKLDKWIASGGDEKWLRSIDEDELGGPGAMTATANDGDAAPSKATRQRREPLPRKSSKNSRWTPISPGTKPSRLKRR